MSPVEQIKSKLDIVEYISQYVNLKKTGRFYKANCPFHSERNPSFIVSPERQLWRCFGACQEGGDVIKFVMKWEKMTFFEALKFLAEKTGVKLDEGELADRDYQKRTKILTINQLAKQYFNYLLAEHQVGRQALSYLKERGIREQTIKYFGLGYAPQSWDSLTNFLKKKGFDREILIESGLVIQSSRGRDVYDRFRGRIIFPLENVRGEVIGFSGRLLRGDGSGKYINTPETVVYHKRETLWGISKTIEQIKKIGWVLVVEGEFDLLSCFQAGIDNVVAIKGSAFTEEQLELIGRFTKHIVLSLDTDNAGSEAMLKAVRLAENADFRLEVVNYQDLGKDPDEAIRNQKEHFLMAVKKRESVYEYLIKYTAQKYLIEGNIYAIKEAVDFLGPFLENISNPIVKSYFIKQAAARLSIEPDTLEKTIKKSVSVKKKFFTVAPIVSDEKKNERRKMESYLLSLVLLSDDPIITAKALIGELTEGHFEILSIYKIIKLLSEQKGRFQINHFLSVIPQELLDQFDEAYLRDEELMSSTNIPHQIGKIIKKLKINYLKSKLKEMVKEGIQDREKWQKYTQELNKLSSEINEI